MIDWAVAFSGWATALVFGLAVGEIARRLLRWRRRQRTRALARIEVRNTVAYLGQAEWRKNNPGSHPRNPAYPLSDLFALWAPDAMESHPQTARDIGWLHSYAQHVYRLELSGAPPHAWDVWTEGLIDVGLAAYRISEALDLDLGSEDELLAYVFRDYSIA